MVEMCFHDLLLYHIGLISCKRFSFVKMITYTTFCVSLKQKRAVPIGLNHLQGAFFLLFLGCGLAALTQLIEKKVLLFGTLSFSHKHIVNGVM